MTLQAQFTAQSAVCTRQLLRQSCFAGRLLVYVSCRLHTLIGFASVLVSAPSFLSSSFLEHVFQWEMNLQILISIFIFIVISVFQILQRIIIQRSYIFGIEVICCPTVLTVGVRTYIWNRIYRSWWKNLTYYQQSPENWFRALTLLQRTEHCPSIGHIPGSLLVFSMDITPIEDLCM